MPPWVLTGHSSSYSYYTVESGFGGGGRSLTLNDSWSLGRVVHTPESTSMTSAFTRVWSVAV